MRRHNALILVILASATLWAQSSSAPGPVRREPVVTTSNAEGVATANRARAAANQNLQDMGVTVGKMKSILKQMRAKTSSSKDSMAKANLEMWALMVDQLDKQYEQLRLVARQREDLEMRRAALYKQADERAAEATRRTVREAARAAAAGSSAVNPVPAGPTAQQSIATPPASSSSPK